MGAMSHFDDAAELVRHAKDDLAEVKKAYNESLHDKSIKPALLIKIKNLMENLRSALDFGAHGLFAKHGSSAKAAPRIYFPYATAAQDLAAFRQFNRIEQCIPGITAAPNVVATLEGMQHFADSKNRWVPIFMDLNNENKHQRLTPQVRKETKELRITGGGAGISLGQGASISVGAGASISIGGAIITGGQTFDVNNPPRVRGGKVEVITWVSFQFESNGEQVLPLLEQATAGVDAFVTQLAAL